MSALTIRRVTPQAGVPGGHVTVHCTGMAAQGLETCRVVFGSVQTRPALIAPSFILGLVPEATTSHTLTLVQHGRQSNSVPFRIATVLAENLHPVANPAVDSHGTIYTTISGTKGQHIPVSVYRVTRLGDVEPFATGISNPTGLAFGADGALYISSRHEGRLYRVNADGLASPFADGLGVATGLAFAPDGWLYVGDRRGAIYRVSDTGDTQPFAKLQSSVGSYHLAYGDDGWLYVSYPTLSGDDRVYRIAPDGEVHMVMRGLGRAQGLAFDLDGNLYVVAYRNGAGGVLRITPAGDVHQVIAGVHLVGLAFGMDGELILADNSTLYKLDLGIRGRPLVA